MIENPITATTNDMLSTIDTALKEYLEKWTTMAADRKNPQFFDSLQPTAVGWKAEDRAHYDRLVTELHDQCSYVVETWVNGRWIAKMVLRDSRLSGGIGVLKIMQRRPGSDDPIGLDHVDFYADDIAQTDKALQHEQDLKSTTESNEAIDNYTWLSIWFEGTEAKIKSYTVLDTVGDELQKLSAGFKLKV